MPFCLRKPAAVEEVDAMFEWVAEYHCIAQNKSKQNLDSHLYWIQYTVFIIIVVDIDMQLSVKPNKLSFRATSQNSVGIVESTL